MPGFEETLQLVAYVSSDEGCDSRQIRLVNYARAHWAYDPLPRFGDDRWLYGDLHYHSQSTDNEGESGYSYRAVAEALGALGVDFTFATDHASDSEQVVDLDNLDWGDFLPQRYRGLRDLNQARWDASLFKLHGLAGANADVAETWPQDRKRIPRLFLGAEVDVMPEVGLAPTTLPYSPYWYLSYGNGRVLDLYKWTTDGFETFGGSLPTITISDLPLIFQPFIDRDGVTAYKLGDIQGLNERHVGRQHVLHLPRFTDQPLGFVGSRTGPFGGATRHAVESNSVGTGVLPEIASKQGVAFLAHPLAAGGGGPGPGIAPYTDYQYTKLFEQQSLAGLQLWNENARMSSAGCFCDNIIVACGCPATGDYHVSGYEWVSMTNSGSHMNGWEDGQYRYAPMFDLNHWTWQRIRFGVDQTLHQGAYVWDRMLRWGLDQGRTELLAWLPAGEPRRMFMAGGSDAHGDWNYRREGYMRETSEANDTAIAKVRNLVFAGRARTGCRPGDWLCFDPVIPAFQSTHDQAGVTDALAEGKFSVTDGPAVRLVVDRNRNGVIDDHDYPMGSTVELFGDEQLPILVQWDTTGEFGAVERVDLYVGVDSNPQCVGECMSPVNESRARTYAPPDHGARRDADEVNDRFYNGMLAAPGIADPPAPACAGRCRMQDGYWLPAEGAARQKLRYLPGTADAYRGTYQVTLNLDDYPSSGAISPAPTRAYVRAFVRTKRQCDLKSPSTPVDVAFSGRCVPRYGFANPVWALRKPWTAGQLCPLTDRSLDRDRDGSPDLCDAAPDTAASPSWSRLFGGAQWDSADALAFDSAGAVYVAGSAYGAGRIERSQTAQEPYAASGMDGMLLKYNAAGELIARFSAMGTGAAAITDVAVDFIGNVYITGHFNGAVQLGADALSSLDGDPFVAKLRGVDLSVIWLRRLSGAGYGRATSVALTPDGQVAVVGDFTGTLTTSTGKSSLTSEGAADCFALWYSTAGTQLSLQRIGGTGDCTAVKVVADGQSRVYVAATYNGAVRAGLYGQTSTSRDSLIVRFGSQAEIRTPTWVSWLGNPTINHDASIADLEVLPGGDLVLTGSFSGTLTSGRDALAFTSIGASWGVRDAFFLKLTAATGATVVPPLWRFGEFRDDALTGLAVDSAGRVLLTGWFSSNIVSTPRGNLALTGSSDGMVFLLDASLQLTWMKDFGTSWSSSGRAAAFSNDGRMAFAGSLMGQVFLDERRAVSSAGDRDGFFTVYRTP